MTYRVRMKDPVTEGGLFYRRALMAGAVVLILFLALILRLFYLQVLSYEEYVAKADRNRISTIPLAPTRGLIYDRNGVVLAENRTSFSLEVMLEKTRDVDALIDELSSVITISDDDRDRFAQERRQRRKGRAIPIRTRLSEKEVAQFSVNQHRFPAVSLRGQLIRHYPFGEQFVHAIGYVGRINDREWEKLDQANYAATSHIGKVGLERFYEPVLHGAVGYQEIETDVHDRLVRVLNRVAPIDGKDLHLHLDSELQFAALSMLGEQRGVIVAIDPNDGGVLALVSAPGFDPNPFVTGIDSLSYRALNESPDAPMFNRAINGVYPPGSTVKPHLALAGLMSGVTQPSRKVWDPGWYQLPGDERKYRDFNWHLGGHGWVDLHTSIIISCDTYFYDMANRMGIDQLHDYMQRFGFGQKTGLDVYEEASGLLPSSQWKRRSRKQAWYPGETLSVGIGQGYWNATSLQLVSSTAAIANGGTRYELQLVDALGVMEKRQDLSPQLAEHQLNTIPPEHLKLVRDAMKEVVHGARGTARKAFTGIDYLAAGKTGTAQVASYAQDAKYDATKVEERFRDNALFVGYAPYDKPKIAIIVLVENVMGGGGSNAAPLARRVIDAYLEKNGRD